MKEFVEKLIGRLEYLQKDKYVLAPTVCYVLGGVKQYVNQLAEEYKGNLSENLTGWVPCSERLPEEKEQERTVYDAVTLAEVDIERYTASELVNVTVRHCDSERFFVSDDMTVDGKWVNFDGVDYEVIAWQPLPEPYQPKGE